MKPTIDNIIDEIEAGTWDFDIHLHEGGDLSFELFGKYSALGELWSAVSLQSLNAAETLHNMLIPTYGVTIHQWDGNAIVEVWKEERQDFVGVSKNKSTAWVIAILKAFIEKEK